MQNTKTNTEEKDIVVIGAGISGAVLAERYATHGCKVLVIEKRDHIGGNCYDYIDENGILVSKYGAHLFHTSDQGVWDYVNRFSEWYPWEHRVVARVDGKLVPLPVNIDTINALFGTHIRTRRQMERWIEKHKEHILIPCNGKEMVLSKVGPAVYEKIFKYYTWKQWNKYPEQLDASVLARIPVRLNRDDRYFSDKYQALPKGGYTRMFERILSHPNIEVRLNTDYLDIRGNISYRKLFYTGPIDRFFGFANNPDLKLEYRSFNFVFETHDEEFFQENSVVNYPGNDVGYTRIIEYKHFGNQKSSKTTVVKEYTTSEGDPYYPVPNERNRQLYERYREMATTLPDIYFVGRLANYKYFNMDQAFRNALDVFSELELQNQVAKSA